jgi:urease accessory protein
MTAITEILSELTDRQFEHRDIDPLIVGWGDAKKHRRLVRTRAGRELALQLPRGTFLADGAVLHDDGHTVVVVRRPPEDAIVVDLTADLDTATGAEAVRRALLLGYQLGNQHAPVELAGTELRTPLMTGPGTQRRAALSRDQP